MGVQERLVFGDGPFDHVVLDADMSVLAALESGFFPHDGADIGRRREQLRDDDLSIFLDVLPAPPRTDYVGESSHFSHVMHPRDPQGGLELKKGLPIVRDGLHPEPFGAQFSAQPGITAAFGGRFGQRLARTRLPGDPGKRKPRSNATRSARIGKTTSFPLSPSVARGSFRSAPWFASLPMKSSRRSCASVQ
jgi:hypothetical protein